MSEHDDGRRPFRRGSTGPDSAGSGTPAHDRGEGERRSGGFRRGDDTRRSGGYGARDDDRRGGSGR
ncbi:hypothetical protein, partial [Nocardia nova]|uniref:hypothetical protein n=1 Tax=Nocardia nova TaxID=37330 RepID=UPI003F6BFD8D